MVFPKVGIYQLELGCTPKAEGDFQPFRFRHDVTVASGTTAPSPTTSQASENPARVTASSQSDSPNSIIPEWIVAAIIPVVLAGIGVFVWQIVKNRKQG